MAYRNFYSKLLKRVPFERYLRFLFIDHCPVPEIKKALKELCGFKVSDDSFLSNFKKEMIESSEVVKTFFEKNPKKTSIAFKSCLVFLEIEELYGVAKLNGQQFTESWLNEVGNFASVLKKPACISNIYKARDKSIEEIQDMLSSYYRYDISVDNLKKYFYYFFEVSWMTANYYQYFAEHQCSEILAHLYQLINEQEDDRILWALDKDRPKDNNKYIERQLRYLIPVVTKDVRELGEMLSNAPLSILRYFRGGAFSREVPATPDVEPSNRPGNIIPETEEIEVRTDLEN